MNRQLQMFAVLVVGGQFCFNGTVAVAQLADGVVMELNYDDTVIDAQAIVDKCTSIIEGSPRATDSSVAQAYKLRGTAYLLHLGKADLAAKDFAALCKRFPRDPQARVLLAWTHGVLGQLDEAGACVRDALDLDPNNAAAFWIQATIHESRGQNGEAIQLATKAIEIDGSLAEAYYLRGIVHYKAADHKKCLADMDTFLTLRPLGGMHPDASYYVRGSCFIWLNRPMRAIPNFLMARKLSPKSSCGAMGLCQAYLDLEKWNLAAYFAEECLRLDEKAVGADLLRAQAYLKIGKRDESRKITEKLALNAKDPIILSQAGNLYAQMGEYEKANSLIDQALREAPNCIQGLLAKASLLSTCPEKKYRDGGIATKLASKAHFDLGLPEYSKCHTAMHLAEAYAECENFEKAVAYAKAALEVAGTEFGRRKEFEDKLGLFQKKMPFRATPIK